MLCYYVSFKINQESFIDYDRLRVYQILSDDRLRVYEILAYIDFNDLD